MKSILFIFLIQALGYLPFAQSTLFKAGDRVCFVGNSITAGGGFHHNISLYYTTRFPNQPLTFINCGVPGDQCYNVLKRMNSDILLHHPTYAVIKLGMNDVMRKYYGSIPTNNVDTLRLRENAINVYKEKFDSIIHIFLSKNIKVILQKPTIYDQTAIIKKENNFGVNDALKVCADYIQTLADKYQLPVVDYWTILNKINTDLQKKEASATIIGQDRVHPGAEGHLIMAYQFLKTTNSPKYVAQIIIDNNTKRSNQLSTNCTLKNVEVKKGGFQFKVKENALPFPISDDQKQGLELVYFIDDLSVEQLVVNHCTANKYELTIDDSIIGFFSAAELSKGINLSNCHNTPQYQQANTVKTILNKLWKDESDIRTIAFVEYNTLNTFQGNLNDLGAVKTYLDSVYSNKFSKTEYASYYKSQFEKYLKLSSMRKLLTDEVEKLRVKAYQAAQPVEHQFAIKEVN